MSHKTFAYLWFWLLVGVVDGTEVLTGDVHTFASPVG